MGRKPVVRLIAKGKKMKLYRKIFPYLLLGSAALFNHNSADAQNTSQAGPVISKELIANASYSYRTQYNCRQQRLIARAENTRDMYMDNMLGAQKRLSPKLKTKGYHAAVRQELPGAPVGLHCMYGQYTQLMRALNQNGDTLTVIPTGAKSACTQFKEQMRRKYSKPEYADVIKEGRVFESDSAYNAALDTFLAQRGLTGTSNPEKVAAAKTEFAKRNFSADHVNPGSIWIVPRFRGAKNKFHAIMFLGKGRLENGEFIPDSNGRYMYTAHNSERIGDLFKNWDMSNVFSADIEKILTVEYGKELKRLESLPRDRMVQYLTAGTTIRAEDLTQLSRMDLIRMVQAKYFGDDMKKAISQPQNAGQIAMLTMNQSRV